jgi:hypothetical protein
MELSGPVQGFNFFSIEFHVTLIASRNGRLLLYFHIICGPLVLVVVAATKRIVRSVEFHDPTVSSVGSWPSQRQSLAGQTETTGKKYPRQAAALVPAEGDLIVWKPYVFSPHIGEELNVDSVPLISCTGAENCLNGQLTGYMVPNCRRNNRYRKGRNGYLRTMETVGASESTVCSYRTT